MHFTDKRAFVELGVHGFRQALVYVATNNAELATTHFTVFNDLINQALHHVGRDRKTDTYVATVWPEDSGVNAHQFTVQVNQCTT